MTIVGPVAVYRLFDGQERLLYVGVTESPAARWRQHAATKPWWDEVADATIDWHSTREEAFSAEATAIVAEKPAYNIAGTLGDLSNAMPPGADGPLFTAQTAARITQIVVLYEAAADAAADAEHDLHTALREAVDAGATQAELVAAYGRFYDPSYSEIPRLIRAREKVRKAQRAEARAAAAKRRR